MVAATPPVVPVFIQRIAQRRAGALAYVPTRAPFGYRYLSYAWNAKTGQFSVRVHDRHYRASNANRTVTVTAEWFRGSCAAGNEKAYQVGGNRVFSAGGDLAWRCVKGANGRTVKLLAAGRNMPASTLAIVASSTKRI